MQARFLCLTLLLATAAHAEIKQVPIQSGIELAPNQAHVVTVNSAEPVEIG